MNKSPTPKASRRTTATQSAAGPAKRRTSLKPPTRTKSPAASRRRTTQQPPAAATEAAATAATKQAKLIALLSQASGASLADLMSATGWQAHSVRGVISGVLRKRLQLPVISETVDGTRRYRIEKPA